QCDYSEPDPEAEGIIGTGIDIISLARLGGGRVEVDDKSHAGEDEQEAYHHEAAQVTRCLVENTQHTQYKRNSEEVIAPFVFSQNGRKFFKRVPRPQPLCILVITFAAYKVEEEIAHVHEPNLVLEHIPDVMHKLGAFALSQPGQQGVLREDTAVSTL